MASIEDVVSSGACVGCGGCEVATGGAITVSLGRYGSPQAVLEGVDQKTKAAGSRVCPFAHESPNEDEVADRVFDSSLNHDPRLGRYLTIAAAQVRDDDYLMGSSSGGMTSWVVRALFDNGLVDGVIHVGRESAEHEGELFGYTVSHSAEEITARRKSAYYATSFAEAVESIRGNGKRYALVGVPCFITAARHVAREVPELDEQFAFYVGLVCGHLKTRAFAELLAWQTGIAPGDLAEVDFRIKYRDRDAGDYGFSARAKDDEAWRTQPNRTLVGANWGHAMFQLGACDFCDDIFAETADVVLGDAWLDDYRNDWRGTNVVITRHPAIQDLLTRGEESGALRLSPLSADDAARSQAGNFRHRRDGLAVRLADDIAAGSWVPRKRVQPDADAVSPGRRAVVRQRREISTRSHALFAEAKQQGSLKVFLHSIRPLVNRYVMLDLGPLMGRLTVHAPWLARSRFLRTRWVRAVLARKRTTR